MSIALKGGASHVKGHWKDEKHEDDGTDRAWVQTASGQRSPGIDLLDKELVKIELLQGELNEMSWKGAWDDVSGMELDAQKVCEARKEEMGYIRKMKVYVKVPRSEADAAGILTAAAQAYLFLRHSRFVRRVVNHRARAFSRIETIF